MNKPSPNSFSSSPHALSSPMKREAITPLQSGLPASGAMSPLSSHPAIPEYLEQTYWWAYVHPNAVRFFERQWLVNLILWGNFTRLRDAAIEAMQPKLDGHTLQIACVYGDFTQRIVKQIPTGGRLDVVDVAPVQLNNLENKLGTIPNNVVLSQQDSSTLSYDDNSFDSVLLFFLLHEQPEDVRAKTVKEAFRVVKPGGKVVFVDYHQPVKRNPFRYIMWPVLKWLEPFALALWEKEISSWIPDGQTPSAIHKTTYFGGLYQRVVCDC
ncbi:rhodoquinone biosynthesis methyltransferase RquA [Magnetococcus sp. PR-3]|uniref:rhodoquinone biosynthesis methyltransferase RquA n=1 Tax=Magnetococcus sp. PR-3 TaxID=3120355 RepID=UPI002FCE15C0